MPDSELLQAAFNAGGEVRLEPRTYELDWPLVVPPERGLTVSGCGMGLTELRLLGEGASVITGLRDRPTGALTFRDFSVHPGHGSRAGGAFDIQAPYLFAANRGHSAEFVAERIEVCGTGYAGFSYGFFLNNLTGPKVDKCWVSGRFSDVTSEALQAPGAMQCAFYMGGSQEAKITNSYAACARQGVFVNVLHAGCGEGIEVSGNALICIDDTIVLMGQPPFVHGGWATPWAVVERNHLFYLQRAVMALDRSDVVIAFNSICGSHLLGNGSVQVGFYLVRCQNTRLHGNSFWNPSLSGRVQGYGMVLDGCSRGSIVGNVIDPSLEVGVWFAETNGQNPGWQGNGNVWGGRHAVLGNPLQFAA